MSKMFDSLRRAEAERRKRIEAAVGGGRTHSAPVMGRGAPTLGPVDFDESVTPSPHSGAEIPDEFLRELGILHNSVDTSLGTGKPASLLFASPTPEEGATTLAVSYAGMLGAQPRGNVLLVEANARRPSLAWRLGLEQGAGITDYLVGKSSFDQIVQTSPKGGFDVIHVGEPNPATVQLHLDAMFPRLLQEALTKYGRVLVDGPPVIGSPETPPMSRHVDGIALVVHCGRTKREVAQRALGVFKQFGGNVLGVILNRKKYYIPDFIYRRI